MKTPCLMNDLSEEERHGLAEYTKCQACSLFVRAYELQKGEYLCDGWGNFYNTWYHSPQVSGGWVPYCFKENK